MHSGGSGLSPPRGDASAAISAATAASLADAGWSSGADAIRSLLSSAVAWDLVLLPPGDPGDETGVSTMVGSAMLYLFWGRWYSGPV